MAYVTTRLNTLNASIEPAYRTQVCSADGSTPESRNRNRSIGPRTRGKGRRSPSKTRTMYAPSGLVVSRTSPEKRASWPHAAAVMGESSETLGAHQRVDGIDGQEHGDDAAQDVLSAHGCWFSSRPSQP